MHLLKPLVLSSIFLLISCSRFDLAIKWADTLLYYELKSVFDFEGKQKKVVEGAADALIANLKMDWLPAIADRLGALSEKVNVSTEDEIRHILVSEVEFVNGHLKKLYALVAKEIPTLAKVITADNWAYFKNEFEDKNKEILTKDSKSKIIDNIERFLGPLSKQQKKLVEIWSEQNPSTPELRVQNRRHLIKEIDTKITPWSAETWSQVVLDWLKNIDTYNLPAYKDSLKKRTDSIVTLLVDVLKTMSDGQKKNLKNNLLEWQENLK